MPIWGSRVLEVVDIHTYYSDSHVLQGVSLTVPRGQCVALLGRNGVGKTTTLRSVLGYTPPRRGTIRYCGADITREQTYRIVRRGIGYVPEDRGIFPSLTLSEHLRAAYAQARHRPSRRRPEDIYALFPRLAERRDNYGNQLSGGEQQMLAIGRALVGDPDLLVLDEPSEGLAPVIIDTLEEAFLRVKAEGKTILLVEQNYYLATALADYVYVLSQGCVQFEGTPMDLEANPSIKHTFLGV
jgi:branched-chain amino acid transport system ATP-binding protein